VITPHLSLEEINQKIRRSKDLISRQQLKVIKYVLTGMTQKRVAEKLGYSPAWVHTIIRRYNEHGPQALRDHRKDNLGRPFKLSNSIRAEMKTLVSTPPQEGVLWTGPLLIEWVKKRTGDKNIDPKRGWEWLR
jgi:transposase